MVIVCGALTTAQGPRPLYSVAAAFDETRGRLVVFGGYGQGGYSGETWEWDGRQWMRTAADGPAPRNSPVMVFDSRRNRMVMFGGDTRDRLFGDTWAYDGRSWTKLAEEGPAPRSTHMLAYDAARDRVVLFGGFTQRNGRQPAGYLSDTWEFDGSRWTRVAEGGPDGRTLAAFAYDASARKVVMFGGSGPNPNPAGPPPPSATLGDTWEWDGRRWQQVTGDAPPARDHVSMAYDAGAKRLVMSGGHRAGGGQLDDVWQRVGTRWSRVSATGTPALAGHRVLYDANARRITLFGGFGPADGPTADIWLLNGDTWGRWPPAG